MAGTMTSQLSFRETGPCWVCGGTALARFHEAHTRLLERGANRIRSWRLTQARRSGSGAARRAASLSPNAFRRSRVSSSGCTTSAGLPSGSQQEFDVGLQGSDLPTAFSTTLGAARPVDARARCSTSAAHAGRFIAARARRRLGAPKELEINPRTATYAAARTGAAGPSVERRAAAGARHGVTTPSRSPTSSSTFRNRWPCSSTVRRARRRWRVGRRQGAVRASAAAQRDLARAPQPAYRADARRQPRAHQPLFARRPCGSPSSARVSTT